MDCWQPALQEGHIRYLGTVSAQPTLELVYNWSIYLANILGRTLEYRRIGVSQPSHVPTFFRRLDSTAVESIRQHQKISVKYPLPGFLGSQDIFADWDRINPEYSRAWSFEKAWEHFARENPQYGETHPIEDNTHDGRPRGEGRLKRRGHLVEASEQSRQTNPPSTASQGYGEGRLEQDRYDTLAGSYGEPSRRVNPMQASGDTRRTDHPSTASVVLEDRRLVQHQYNIRPRSYERVRPPSHQIESPRHSYQTNDPSVTSHKDDDVEEIVRHPRQQRGSEYYTNERGRVSRRERRT